MTNEMFDKNEKYKNFFNYLKTNINWKLLIIIFLFQLLPSIYKILRIYFLGTLPNENAYNIASHILWLNIFYEIITEAIVIPLFYLFNKVKNNKNLSTIFTILTFIIFTIYLIFTLAIYFNVENILKTLIANNDDNFYTSVDYIKLEVWGTFLFSIFSYLFVSVTIFKFNKYLLISFVACFLYTFLTIMLDLFLVSSFSFSWNLSVLGIGWNSIIVNLILSLVFLIYFAQKNIKIWNFNFHNFYVESKYFKKYLALFVISLIEVSVRNLCFYFMIINPINSLNSSGIYWTTNTFIWSWLLLPVSTLSIYIKECFALSNNKKWFFYELIFYIIFISIISFIWIICIPINPIFIKVIMNESKEYQEVNKLVLILIPFYILFSYSIIIDSIFINRGKISWYCIQSLIVNLTIYPIYFILWQQNIWVPTLESISIMFGLGMTLHFVIDLFLFFIFLKKEKMILMLPRKTKL